MSLMWLKWIKRRRRAPATTGQPIGLLLTLTKAS